MTTMTPSDAAPSSVQRCFFALWPAAEVAQELYRRTGEWLAATPGRRVVAGNIHLTLAFLGAVPPELEACYRAAAAGVRSAAFALTLDTAGCFGRRGLLWAGPAETPAPLLDLVQQLNQALVACEYKPDPRPFRAHLTLARNLRRCPILGPVDPLVWQVREFVLMASTLHARGAEYAVLERFPLA